MYTLFKWLFWIAVIGSVLFVINADYFWFIAVILVLTPFLYWWDTGNWIFSKKPIKEKKTTPKFYDHM